MVKAFFERALINNVDIFNDSQKKSFKEIMQKSIGEYNAALNNSENPLDTAYIITYSGHNVMGINITKNKFVLDTVTHPSTFSKEDVEVAKAIQKTYYSHVDIEYELCQDYYKRMIKESQLVIDELNK